VLLSEHPEHYWHCHVRLRGAQDRDYAVVNDLSFAALNAQVVDPWHACVPFPVAGKVVSRREDVEEIKITHTGEPKQSYSDRHYAQRRANGVIDWATDSQMLPIWQGEDRTHELLFAGLSARAPEPDLGLVLQLCERLPRVAQILAVRDRGKPAFVVADEYDVQDLLHAVLRGYLRYTVHEEPLAKIGAAKSGRADVAIEDLGTIVEVKYVRRPRDQQRLVEEYAQDLLLYTKWPHLRHFVYLCYNADDLRDAEALKKLEGKQKVNEVNFSTYIVLA